MPFPFSDASATKRRPALIIAESDSNNIIVCPITSKPGRDSEIKLEDQDFSRLLAEVGERGKGKGERFDIFLSPLTCIPFPTRVQKTLLQEV
ncbi:MAG: type II toxin-antitoxin system PemK/MazF family toxin [Nostoc sp. DedQUE12a]|nr:type II toxin-antitoxin system PemK/MazF family toxin [Nostoc sp. DedQUE12a]